MKYLLLLIVVFSGDLCYAETDSVGLYVDYHGKKCEPYQAYYFRSAKKEGLWWHVKDFYIREKTLKMDGIYKVLKKDSFSVEQGMFLHYHPNGRIERKIRYINGLEEGLIKGYDSVGEPSDSGYWKKGVPYRVAYKWYKEHKIHFKGVYDEDGSGIGEEWEYSENGVVTGYGKTARGYKKDSVWVWRHSNGVISAIEHYKNDSLQSIQCFNDDGTPVSDSCKPEIMPGPSYNVNVFLANNINYPEDARMLNIQGKVDVMFTVTETGKIKITRIFYKENNALLAEEAANVVNAMPAWKPGKIHGRPVKVIYTLPVSFKLD